MMAALIDNDLISCLICSETFLKNGYVSHVKACTLYYPYTTKLSNNIYQCKLCSNIYKNKYCINRHFNKCLQKNCPSLINDSSANITINIQNNVQNNVHNNVQTHNIIQSHNNVQTNHIQNLMIQDTILVELGNEDLTLLTIAQRNQILSANINAVLEAIKIINFNDDFPNYKNINIQQMMKKLTSIELKLFLEKYIKIRTENTRALFNQYELDELSGLLDITSIRLTDIDKRIIRETLQKYETGASDPLIQKRIHNVLLNNGNYTKRLTQQQFRAKHYMIPDNPQIQLYYDYLYEINIKLQVINTYQEPLYLKQNLCTDGTFLDNVFDMNLVEFTEYIELIPVENLFFVLLKEICFNSLNIQNTSILYIFSEELNTYDFYIHLNVHGFTKITKNLLYSLLRDNFIDYGKKYIYKKHENSVFYTEYRNKVIQSYQIVMNKDNPYDEQSFWNIQMENLYQLITKSNKRLINDDDNIDHPIRKRLKSTQ